jgi:hypothetical protein
MPTTAQRQTTILLTCCGRFTDEDDLLYRHQYGGPQGTAELVFHGPTIERLAVRPTTTKVTDVVSPQWRHDTRYYRFRLQLRIRWLRLRRRARKLLPPVKHSASADVDWLVAEPTRPSPAGPP